MRLKDVDDSLAWIRFNEIYIPLIYKWVSRTGIASSDVDDVTQNIALRVAQRLPEYVYDESKSFRAWLYSVTRTSAINFWIVEKRREDFKDFFLKLNGSENAPDPLNVFVQQEYTAHVVKHLLKLVRPLFEEKTVRAFEMQVIEETSAARTAEILKMSRDQVYTAKSRVFRRLREIGKEFLEQ